MRRSVRIAFLGGLTMGAALSYFLDPVQGRRRRVVARDRAARGWDTARDVTSRISHDLARSSHGARCRARALFGNPAAADDLLAHRVRTRLERIMAHPEAIEVVARKGEVTLQGPVDTWEAPHVLAEAGSSRVDLQACKLEYSIVSPK